MANPIDIAQDFSTTLNVGGGINNSQTTSIVLTSVSGLPTDGGILCFDWATTLDTSVAEYIEYTGISGNTLTGVIRGVEGFSAKAHSNGCTIVGVVSRAHIKRLRDKLTGNDAVALQDTNANEILKVAQVASAVNEVTLTNAATATAPIISATGGDTNINLKLLPKGTGVVVTDGPLNYAADAEASDTYAVTITGISAYATGLHVRFKANTANTGAATLNVNSLGAKTIKKSHDQDLADNDIESGQIVDLVYDGTNFQMQSQVANSASSSTNGTSVIKSAVQAITTGTWTAVTWDTETYDVGGMHESVTNPSRITIQTAGVYVFSFGADWASNTTGERICGFAVNGTREFESSPQTTIVDGRCMMAISFVRKLAATNYVEVLVYQTSGGNLNLNNTTASESVAQFTAQYLASGT